jgi:hypothetical protein
VLRLFGAFSFFDFWGADGHEVLAEERFAIVASFPLSWSGARSVSFVRLGPFAAEMEEISVCFHSVRSVVQALQIFSQSFLFCLLDGFSQYLLGLLQFFFSHFCCL